MICVREGCADEARVVLVIDGERKQVCIDCYWLRARLWPASAFQFRVLE